MKKIITLLAILLISTGLFAQGNILTGFGRRAEIKKLKENPTYLNPNYLDLCTLSFTEDNKLYLLSYPPNSLDVRPLNRGSDIVERNIYLYSIDDDGYEIVSDIILTDFRKITDGVQSYANSRLTRRPYHDLVAKVTKRDDGSVSIGFPCFIWTEGDIYRWKYTWVNVNLFPNDDGTYKSITEIKND